VETAFSLKHQEYIERNKLLVAENAFSGKAIMSWQKWAVWSSLVEYYGPTAWIDYGCGPATSYKHNGISKQLADSTGSEYILYDPCHNDYSEFPNVKEIPGILSCDVLEHIPDTDTIMTLSYLFGVCRKFMYLHISNKKGARGFPDGEGDHDTTHVTLKTREEWVEIISDFARNCGFPVVLTTDQPEHFDTFDHDGRGFTYDDWNMPSELQNVIANKRENFVASSPEMLEEFPWPLTRTNFNV